MVLLITSDEKEFVVDREVAERSVMIKNTLGARDPGEIDQPVQLAQVSSFVFEKVLEYCEHHRGEPLYTADDAAAREYRKRSPEIGEWDRKFIDVGQEMLFEIILAANYLDIKPLLDVGCKFVGGMIEGKSPEEIKRLFNIVDDLTLEEGAVA